jgi:hypothetical protein
MLTQLTVKAVDADGEPAKVHIRNAPTDRSRREDRIIFSVESLRKSPLPKEVKSFYLGRVEKAKQTASSAMAGIPVVTLTRFLSAHGFALHVGYAHGRNHKPLAVCLPTSEAGALSKSLRYPSFRLMSTPPSPESPDNEGLYK